MASQQHEAVIGALDALATEDINLPGEWSADVARQRCQEYAALVTQLLDSYTALETAAHSVVNAYHAKWTRSDARGPITRLQELLSA